MCALLEAGEILMMFFDPNCHRIVRGVEKIMFFSIIFIENDAHVFKEKKKNKAKSWTSRKAFWYFLLQLCSLILSQMLNSDGRFENYSDHAVI